MKEKNKKHYSLNSKLIKENKIDSNFLFTFNSLTLEEIIGLKLESACDLVDGKLYGIPLWKSMKSIVNDSILKYAYAASKSKADAARFLGVTISQYNYLIRRYQIKTYFEDNED
jgi:transcriptional regulator with GAF, ATPase, and Fis domain|tara:strand:- start:2240 stop:2581 length:342 start_codon:yes stop_codon:yes gene_type:complete